MKLYLLRNENYEGVDIHGLYSSKKKAIESFPFRSDMLNESNIEEIEVDPPHGEERYELYFYAVAYTDGYSWIGDHPCRKTKSNAEASTPHLSWDEHTNIGSVLAYAPSKEEAAAKAAEGIPMLHPVWQVARFQGGYPGLCEVKHGHPSRVHKWNELPGHKGYAVHEDLETARKILIEHETTGRALPGFVGGGGAEPVTSSVGDSGEKQPNDEALRPPKEDVQNG